MDIRGVYPNESGDRIASGAPAGYDAGMARLFLLAVLACACAAQPVARLPLRGGPVRLEGRALADAAGPWNALGATLFWALWGERHDPARLEANLAYLAAHRVDYVRILGMVGSESWADRAIDPAASDYWAMVDRLFDRLDRHGLRAQVTIFADAQHVMPDATARRQFAAAWADHANRHREQIVAIEIANEYWQNGFGGPDGTEHLRALGTQVAAATAIPVALSSATGVPGDWCRLYAGAAGIDVATVHYDRNTGPPDGPWGPVRQPWRYPAGFDDACRGRLPAAVISNEPIGPQSSVAADDDPRRLALAYATTFISGGAAYVFHAGPGIRGGGAADAARGRAANFFDLAAASLNAIQSVAAILPPGLANWTREDAPGASAPWDGIDEAMARGDLLAAHAASSGEQFVAVLLDVVRPHAVVARRAMRFALIDPANGATIAEVSLPRGAAWTVPAHLPGYLVIGQHETPPARLAREGG